MHYYLDSLIIYVRGCSFTRGGGPKFFCVGQGGDQNFFAHAEGGDKNFFAHAKGGDQKKLATRDHRQTTPPPGKK